MEMRARARFRVGWTDCRGRAWRPYGPLRKMRWVHLLAHGFGASSASELRCMHSTCTKVSTVIARGDFCHLQNLKGTDH